MVHSPKSVVPSHERKRVRPFQVSVHWSLYSSNCSKRWVWSGHTRTVSTVVERRSSLAGSSPQGEVVVVCSQTPCHCWGTSSGVGPVPPSSSSSQPAVMTTSEQKRTARNVDAERVFMTDSLRGRYGTWPGRLAEPATSYAGAVTQAGVGDRREGTPADRVVRNAPVPGRSHRR